MAGKFFMPTSAEHCVGCAFSEVEASPNPEVTQTEGEMVQAHLRETFTPERSDSLGSGQIQEAALERGMSPRRLLAARACAFTIQHGNCPDYFFVNRGRGNNPKLEKRRKK